MKQLRNRGVISQCRHEDHEVRDGGTEHSPVFQESEGEELDSGEESLPDTEAGEGYNTDHDHDNDLGIFPVVSGRIHKTKGEEDESETCSNQESTDH